MKIGYTCLVCGWPGLTEKPEPPFVSYEICSCCGSEYGFDIRNYNDVKKVREEVKLFFIKHWKFLVLS